MLQYGSRLAAEHDVSVQFELEDIDDLITDHYEPIDLVHSTFCLPFLKNPQTLFEKAYALLKPGGQFIFSTGHPLYAGEWVDLEDEEGGLLLKNYFELSDETRTDAGQTGRAHYVRLEELFKWISTAGFILENFCEPQAVAMNRPTSEHVPASVPYWSEEWLELYPVLRCIPIVAVFSLRKPA